MVVDKTQNSKTQNFEYYLRIVPIVPVEPVKNDLRNRKGEQDALEKTSAKHAFKANLESSKALHQLLEKHGDMATPFSENEKSHIVMHLKMNADLDTAIDNTTCRDLLSVHPQRLQEIERVQAAIQQEAAELRNDFKQRSTRTTLR